MYILLKTLDVWEIAVNFDPASWFYSLQLICTKTDILVLGSYNPSEKALLCLKANEIISDDDIVPFSDNFGTNRKEFPAGKPYMVYARQDLLEELAALSRDPHGSIDKHLFFDHALIYRPSEPLVPLMNFHDAFSGGRIYLSGLYSHEVIKSFATSLNAEVKLVKNPEGILDSAYS